MTMNTAITSGHTAFLTIKAGGKQPFLKKVFKSPGGFTLIEILTAIFILALVVTALLGTYRTVLSDVSHIDKRLETYQMVQICLNRITADLQSLTVRLAPAYKPPDLNDPADPYRFQATLDDEAENEAGERFVRLRFTCLTSVSPTAGDEAIVEITYYVTETDEDVFALKRALRTYPFETPFVPKASDPVLCTDIGALRFQFADQEDETHEVWDSETDDFGYATPRSVEMELGLKKNGATTHFGLKIALPVWREEMS